MSASAAWLYTKAREQELMYRDMVKRSWEDDYDIGLGMLEYPKPKNWKLVRKLFNKIKKQHTGNG